MNPSKRFIIIFSVFSPLLVILAAFVIFPDRFKLAVTQGLPYEWIWIFIVGLGSLFLMYLFIDFKHRTEMRGVFEKLDTNCDGYISKEEAHGYNNLNTVFDKFDKNHDGYLTFKEFAKAVRATANVSRGTHRRR